MFILRFIFYILFNLNLFLFASVLQINDCQQQGKYYNSQLTQCGVCSQNCLSCFDDQNCLFCSQNQYLEFQNSGCSKNCQMGYYQNEYLRECIQCKIRNCSICHDIDSCELCNYGWGLKNKICQNQKCSKKIGTYYDQNTDSCKYYCNQKSDENALECVQNKEVSALNKKTIEIENNVDSNIQQIQIVQLDDQTTVIAVDNQRIIYYQYPDLIPYYQLNFNLTISFAHIIDNYIIAIQQDLKTVLRINFQINVIESFQIGECIQPQAFQHFLFCSDYTFFINQIVELTSPLFSTTTFQPQNRILMNQDKSNIQKSFNQSFKSFQNSSEIQQKNIYASEKINERNLQSQSSKIDSLGCIVQIPSQLDIQPHQIPNILKNSTIAIVQEYLQGQIQQLSFNAFIINQDNEILIFDQNTSYLYKINTQNMTDIQILTQLAGVSKVICAQFFNDVLYLILLDQNDNSIGYFLPSSLKSGRFQFNQSDQIKFQYQQIGSIQKCFLVQQSQVLLLQGEKGILQVKTSQLSISGQSQQQIIFSKYPSGKIKQRFGDIVSIFYIQQTDQISIVYKFGFNIVDLQKKQQNIARYLDFQVEVTQQFQYYLVLASNSQQKCIMFNIKLQRFQEFKYDPNPFLQVFIVKTQQYLIIAISLQNNTFNLYLLDEQQEFIGYNFKYNLLSQNQYIQTIQIFANKIFVTSTQNTVILYTIQKNELKFQSSFYYSNFYYLKNENQVFIFSNCQISNALSLTVFDLAKQENINVFFSQSEVISGSTKIYYYDSLQKIVSFSGFRGNNQFKIFDIQQNSFLNISINTTPNQSIQIKNYIIFYLYNSPQSCFIFNLQTLTQTQIKQFLYPTIPYIYSYFLYNDQIYIPISFVNQDCTILYNVDQAQIQQKISSNQNYNIKFIVQQQSQQVVLYDQINTQQIIMNQQLYIKVNITQKEFGFDLQLLPDKIVSNFKQGLYVLNFINKKIDQFTFLQGEDKYIFYWFIYNRQYWIIYYENEVFLLKSQYSDEIKSLGQISYSIYDEKTNILITLSNSQMILNFYLLNNNKTISQTIISQQANPQFQIYQFKDQNLILITIYNSQGYFVNYNKGAVFQFLNGQNQLLFQDGLYVYKDFVITFQYSTLLKFQVVSNKQTISFDLDTFQVVCEFQYKQVIGYIYQQNIKTIVQITSSQVQISNLQSCSFQSQELIGIKFIPSDVLPITYVYYIYLFQASDLLVIASVNGFEVYQFSTMYYQLTYYFNNTLNNAFFVQDTNEIVCYNSDLTFSFFDISTTLFYNQTDLDISSNNNYVWFNDLGIVAQLNQNSGVIDIKDIRTLKMLYQIKLKSMYTIQRYSFFFQEISSHQLIVFVSLTEYHIIDVQTYSYIIYYNSFRCIKQKIFNLNIYCLDDQSQVYILDKLNNSFNSIYKSKNTILNVVDIIILSNEIIQLIYSNNNYTIYQLIIKQESNALDNLNYPFQVIFIDSLLGVQTQSKITIYKISQDNQQNLVVQNIIEIQSNNNIIQSFVINKLDVTYQMIYSTNICGIVYDIQQNQQVGYMQNTAQYQQKIIIDNKYIYFIGSSNFILYDRFTLSKINYYQVNQFIYSNIKDKNLIQAFVNLKNANILFIQKYYNNQKLLSSVVIYGHTYSELFSVKINQLDLNLDTQQVNLKVINQQNQLQNDLIHKDQQTSVFQQNKTVGQLILSFGQQIQQMGDIPIFYYKIFTKSTKIQIQSDDHDQQINSLIISNNNFIKNQFQTIIFFNIKLYIKSEQLKLNPFSSVQNFIFDKVYLNFFNQSSQLVINNCQQIIIQELIIQDQTLKRDDSLFLIQNVDKIIIDTLTVQNFTSFLNQEIISLSNINSININSLTILNSTFSSSLLKFLNCSNINIQNIIVNNTIIKVDSLFNFIKINQLNIQKLTASHDQIQITNQTFKFLRDLQNGTYLKAKQLINNNNQEDSFLIKIQGCQFSSFSNFFITSIHHTGILKSAYYQENLNNQIFNYQINLSSIILSNYIFDKSYEIIYLEGKIININRIEIQNCQFATNVIFFNPEQTGSIVNSVFNQVKLQQGSLLSITGGQIVILNNSYTNITSKVTSVIYSNQITTLNITKSYFIDNSCNSLEILQPCQGGSVNFKQIEQITLIETQFINSFSLDYGGAIYISNQNNYQVEFIKCIFSNCRAQKNSGGAIYFSSSQNITILGSKFSNNTALLERGGAIALYYSNLLQLENSIFLNNRAQIGGGIWYGPYNQSFLNFETQLKTNLFAQNQGFFYGQDIGSNPRKIARVSSQYSQIYDNNIYNISSGNILEQEVYFTFFDEQNRPLNFLDFQKYPQSLEIYNEECSYSLKLDFEKNKNIQIKQGQTLERSNQLGLFQLLISASYKDKNTQQVSISSTPLNNQQQLEYKLILNFRNCTRGELLLQSQNGFIECSQCQEGKYSLITPSQLNKNSLICNSCPNEANQCYKDTIILKDGYWRQSVETDQIYTCKSQGCSETQKNTRNRCIEGYVGPLCDSCDGSKQIWNEQYGKRGEYCLKCKQLGYQYVYFAAILIFYVIYIVYCVGNLIEKKIIITKLILFRKIDLLITSKSNIQGESLTLWIKVFVHYLQICTLIFSFDIQYPKFLSFSLNVFGDPVNLTITSLDCLTQVLNIYPIWLHRLVTQLANIIIQYIFVSLIYYILHLRDSFNKEYKKRFFKISLKTSFVFFYLFYQPSITKLIFSAVFCKQIGDKYYLISDLNQQCYTKTHLIHLIAIIVPLCIFWCLFIPLLLYRKLGQIKNKVNLMKTISQIIVYGVIYQGYKITCFNWEIIKIYQKLTLMILINSNLNDVIKLTVIIIVILLYTIYLTIKKPHQSKNLMNCEKMLMVILNFNFLFSFLIVKESKPTNIQLILGYIFIIFCNILAFISFIFLSSNYFVINLDDEDTLSNKIKKNFYQLCKKFPAILKYIHFRRNNVYRIHKLWKKLIEFAKQHKNLNSISSQNRNRIKKQLPISSKISLQQSQISLQTNQRNNLDQDQQFLFSSGLIEEKEKSVSTKIYDTYYRGGQIITQKDIQFNTFNKLQQK
ncbi:hypothetical protein ABPG73_000446 [Tetrahymena malaccensis]